ncbi:MAG: hypothetical protein GX173_15690 [Ruminococcaceae bacterium]|nr:hypothetical protein [Oscillospiraceae bacterium]
MDIARLLLQDLLKKYESSKAFTSPGPVQRRVQLNVYKGEFKPYDIEDYERKVHIHQVISQLRDEQLIDYTWMRGEEQHILHRIWLKIERVDAAYDRAGLVSPKAEAGRVLAEIDIAWTDFQHAEEEGTTDSIAWIGTVLADMRRVLSERQRLTSPLPTSREQALKLVAALRGLIALSLSGQQEMPERVFSIQIYGDSKAFAQQVRTRLASLIRRYLLPGLLGHPAERLDDLDLSEDELLGLVNLSRSPEIFEWSGPLTLMRCGRQLDYGFFPLCGTLSAAELNGLSIELPAQVQRILFVENRTNFYWLMQQRTQNEDWQDTLLIYHGGCFSPARGHFFHQVQKAAEHASASRAEPVTVYHWGDIDLGGFFMFSRLQHSFFPQLKPWHMDCHDLLSNISQAQPISRAYAERLQALLVDERFAVFHDVIKIALERGIRLEQEALLGK